MDDTATQAMLDELTTEKPPKSGHCWQVLPHPDLPGRFWATIVDPSTEFQAPGGVLLCGPNGRRLSMPSIPGLNGSSAQAVEAIRELADSDLTDQELASEISARDTARGFNPLG